MVASQRRSLLTLLSSVLFLTGSRAFAAGVPNPVDWYAVVLHSLHLDHKWAPTVGSLACTLLIALIGLIYRSSVFSALKANGTPSSKFSLAFIVDMIMDLVYSITRDNGGHHYRKYLPVLATSFIFILVNNLSGLIPGFPPATETMDNNVAMGLVIFVWYNVSGLKENGWGYLKHFAGPVAFIAPFFFVIELISHASRPLSLGLRLTGNIFGDHTLLAVFTSISYLVFPALLTFFGLLVAVVQSFVFTLLSGIYLSMAISHDH